MAAVDAKTQIIMDAQACGTGTEQELLLPVVAALTPLCTATTVVTADAGYHSEANLRALAEQGRTALILHQAHDFTYDPIACTCDSPAGKSLHRAGKQVVILGCVGAAFREEERGCGPCEQRSRCLRTPERTATRQVVFFDGRAPNLPETCTRQMPRRLVSADGRAQYGRRFATVEPVFANLRHNKGLARFVFRGRAKADGRWKSVCLVHNIEQLAHAGYAA